MSLKVFSMRKVEDWPSWHLVYEWEDEILKSIPTAKLSCESQLFKYAEKVVRRLKCGINGQLLCGDDLFLGFEMSAKTVSDLENRKNYIPVIIDFFLDESEIKEFEQAHSKNPIVLISSKEVYDWLESRVRNIKIAHWGLSLPDKYKIDGSERFEKKYDFVLFGRQNPVLRSYLEQYVQSHPELIYVYEKQGEKFHYYTNTGEYVGYYKSRDEYIRLMRMSRMALYSTPGMDSSRKNANGFNQVTPKFLEYMACGCQLVLRYPGNSDTQYYDLPSFCPSVNIYEDFVRVVDAYRASEPDMQLYADYLSHHYTSVRVAELKTIISKLYGKDIF